MILHGDCLDVLKTLDAESIDACVTDPPYELTANKPGGSGAASLNLKSPAGRSRIGTGGGFMGKAWDATGISFDPDFWAEVLRVLKPGAHVLACGGTRTYHRMVLAIEDAGFEIRDCLAWLYGSGFPKSLNLGEGLGTALKPAYEPIVLARKPFKGTVKANVEQFGTGALNIDACRIEGDDGDGHWSGDDGSDATSRPGYDGGFTSGGKQQKGRWPANVVIDEIAAMVIDEMSGETGGGAGGYDWGESGNDNPVNVIRNIKSGVHFDDTGGASRFYYCAKPSREERDMGCYDLPARSGGEATDRVDGTAGLNNPRAGAGRTGGGRNYHPTVKPIELKRWLIRLVTPPNGIVLDPFLGSGTTGIAARYEQRRFIGIEREAAYVEIAERRIAAAAPLFAEVQPEAEAAAEGEAQGDLLAFQA